MVFSDAKESLLFNIIDIKRSYDFARMGHWVYDLRTDMLDWSEGASVVYTGVTGQRLETLKEFYAYIHPDDQQKIADIFRETIEHGKPFDIEHRVLWRDGSVHWIHGKGDLVYEGETPIKLMGMLQDITQRKLAEEELLAEHEFLQCLLKEAPALVMTMDVKGDITFVNPHWQQITGYSAQEVEGVKLIELLVPVADRRSTYGLFYRALEGAVLRAQVNEVVTKSGEIIHVEWYAKRLLGSDADVKGVLVIGQDVSERYRLESCLRESEERFRGLVEMNHDWIWEVDDKGLYTYVSPQVAAVLGYQPSELLGRSPFELMPSLEAKRIKSIFQDLVANQRPIVKLENVNLHKNGAERVMETSGRPFFDSFGNYCGYRGIDRDVSERRHYQQEMELASLALEHTPEGVMITDADLRIIKVNPAFTRMTGYSPRHILGQHPRILNSKRHDTSFYEAMWYSIRTKGQWQGEIWNRRKDGEIYPEWLNICAIRDANGQVTNYSAIFSDISSQNQIRNQLHNLAYYDALTGLPNRELFRDRLEKALTLTQRDESKLAVMFLDLDHFKRVNDSLGHRTGDLLLKQVADVLSRCVRQSDTVARLGGDEFTIMVTNVQHLEDVARIAENILKAMDAPFELNGGVQTHAGVSIGISQYPMDGQDADSLLKHADNAMYRAKEKGRHGYEFFTQEMNDQAMERLRLEQDLREAVDNNLLTLAYQPQVDIETRRINGFEALLRWHHEERGWVPPTLFVAIAEEAGLIGRIGDWVLDTACAQLAQWQRDYDPNLRMAVNVSARQLYRTGLVEKVSDILTHIALTPQTLELELTESSLIEHVDHAIKVLSTLQSLGVELAIDDFGTGYSSLSYLKQFQVDRLKIDRSFVTDISTDPNDAEIVTTIIAMANSLKMKVIAEGVESESQASFLLYHGCNEAQGFYYSSPVPAERVSALLMRGGLILEDYSE